MVHSLAVYSLPVHFLALEMVHSLALYSLPVQLSGVLQVSKPLGI